MWASGFSNLQYDHLKLKKVSLAKANHLSCLTRVAKKMRRVSLASASPMQTRRPNPKGTNCSFLTKRTPPSYFSRNLQKKFTNCFSSRTTFQVWTHEAAPTRPGPGWEFIHVDDNVFHIWWTFKVQSDNISKILLQNKERDDAFFTVAKTCMKPVRFAKAKESLGIL